jgi:hypothetical protein
MPIELRYRDSGAGVVFVCTGTVTAAEFSEANDEIYSRESLDRLRYELTDFTATEHLESSIDETRRNATTDAIAANRGEGLVIAVAGPDDLTFGIARMWQALTHDSNIRTGVFRSVPDAERWIAEALRSA